MKYVQPIGGAVNDPYIDANPGSGIEGSPVPAAAIEHPQREIEAVITGAGLVAANNDLTQLRQAIAKMIQSGQRAVIINNAIFAGAVTGTGKAVYWDSANSRFDLALADGTAKQNCVGFADVANANVYAFGDAVLFAGLTPGARYYLGGTTAGEITATAPDNAVFVGIARNATEVFVDIDAVGGSTKASQAEILAESVVAKYISPDMLKSSARTIRAWVNFDGATGVINASFNVSSVTRNSTGNYTVNFTNAMANTNYFGAGIAGAGDVQTSSSAVREVYGGIKTTTAYQIATIGGPSATMNYVDFTRAGLAIFGN